MKLSVIASLLILTLTGHAANAAPDSEFGDIEVISVKPRSPDIKPFVMAKLTKEQQRRFAATDKGNASAGGGR